jgi:hypothetical protein
MKVVEFYVENCPSQSRNFWQAEAGAGAAQKWTGSATLDAAVDEIDLTVLFYTKKNGV